MEHQADRQTISLIWEQLRSPHRPGRNDGRRTAHLEILKNGWGMSVDIQDVLWETDDRADMLARHHDAFKFLLEPYRLHFVHRYAGPFANKNTLYGHSAMRAADIGSYISEIERLGFSVDPVPFVTALRPALLRAKYLTSSEVTLVRYQMERHGCESVYLKVDDAAPDRTETIRTHSGYRATALFEGDSPVILRVDAPKCRKDMRLDQWIKIELYLAKANRELSVDVHHRCLTRC